MSSISPIASPAEIYQANKLDVTPDNAAKPSSDFGSLLADAVAQVDNLQTISSKGTEALLSGEVDDIAQVMIDGTKAELGLNMVIQVRNKVLDAYNEIMRITL